MSESALVIGESDYAGSLSRESIDDKDRQFQILSGTYEEDGRLHCLPVGYLPGRPGSDLTIVRTMPWTEHPERPFERGRNAAVSLLTEAEIFTVGAPGVGRSDRLTLTQASELLGAGDDGSSFAAVGRATAQALVDAATTLKGPDYLSSRRLVLDLYSQGASIGAGLLGQLPVQPELVIWREMPDRLSAVSLRSFAGNFLKHGGDGFSRYARANQALQGERSDGLASGTARALLDAAANAAYAAGMAGGSLVTDLKGAHQDGVLSDRTRHVVLSGEHSRISLPEHNDQLVKKIQFQIGAAAVRLTVAQGTHTMTNYYELNAGMILRAIDQVEK